MTIKLFNQNNIKIIRDIIDKELGKALKPLGVVIKQGNITYEDDRLKMTNLKFELEGALSEEEKTLKDIKPLISGIDFDKTMHFKGQKIKIWGYWKRSKTPFICSFVDNPNKDKICFDERSIRMLNNGKN